MVLRKSGRVGRCRIYSEPMFCGAWAFFFSFVLALTMCMQKFGVLKMKNQYHAGCFDPSGRAAKPFARGDATETGGMNNP